MHCTSTALDEISAGHIVAVQGAEQTSERAETPRDHNSHTLTRAGLHNDHLGRWAFASVRAQLVWVFVPYATPDHDEALHGY